MALTKHTRTIQIDSPSREQSSSQPPHVDSTLPVIELWYGDITQPGAITTEDIIVLSSNSADTLIGNNSIHSWMKALPNTPQKWFDFYPSLNAR
ncbi:MAG: hypothetical protein KA198_07165, partial [Chitinophagaceae bacterium]|nr:hypothetical protein [Chitinophagaceae bacterium]